jgi:heat shock protein HtpX
VHGYALRAADRASAVAGLTTAVVVLMAGSALIGVAVAGAGGAVAGIAVAVVLTAVVYAAMLARPVSEVEQPELYRLVRELSKAGRLPVPRLFMSPVEQPNSFTVGRGPRTATVCCTEGLLRVLDEAELRGVLGHELAHVSGHDILASSMSAGLATVITFPAGLARFARPGSGGAGRRVGVPAAARAGGGSGSGLGVVESLLMGVFGPVAAVLVRLAMSPEREYRADATGASLTGDPVALASALRKADAGAAELALAPDGRRISVGHLMIVCPFRPEGVARIFLTHPPAGERVRRLEALAGYRR